MLGESLGPPVALGHIGGTPWVTADMGKGRSCFPRRMPSRVTSSRTDAGSQQLPSQPALAPGPKAGAGVGGKGSLCHLAHLHRHTHTLPLSLCKPWHAQRGHGSLLHPVQAVGGSNPSTPLWQGRLLALPSPARVLPMRRGLCSMALAHVPASGVTSIPLPHSCPAAAGHTNLFMAPSPCPHCPGLPFRDTRVGGVPKHPTAQ